MKDKLLKLTGPMALAIVLVLAVLYVCNVQVLPTEEPVARSYGCAVYTEQGCAKFVVASGGEVEVQSGATFDLQSGAATDFSAGVDLDGGLLDLDADGDTSIQADTDDQIDIEVGGVDDFRITTNTLTALSGSTIAANTIAETTAASGVTVDGLTLKDGGIQDSGGFPITGQADVAQIVVTGYTTQTSNLVTLEQSGGTDVVTVTNAGALQAVDLSATDDAIVSDDLTVGGVFNPGFANLTITNGDTITPAYTVYALDPSVASTVTLAASGTEGQILVLINDDANAVVIADTNIRSSDGNVISLAGAYDTVWFVYQDNEWLLMSESANS